MSRFSVASEISNAIASVSDWDRASALRKLVLQLCGPMLNSHPVTSHGDTVTTACQQTLARAYDSLREAFQSGLIDEVGVAIFATDGQREHVICALARMTGLRAERIEPAFYGPSADFLLVICRIHNFAWSSVKALLTLHQSQMSGIEIAELHEEYHRIPIQAAKRFGRFLHVHLVGST